MLTVLHPVQFSPISQLCLTLLTPWTEARQASLFITNSRSLLKLTSKSWWCYPTISSSVIPFSSCLQSFPASGYFQMSQFLSGGQGIGVSASASVLPINSQGWFPVGLIGLISMKCKGLWTVFSNQFSSVQLFSHVQLFVTSWIAAHQASLSITNSRSSLRFTYIESVMPSSHLILGRPLLLLTPIPPSIKVFSNESTLRMRWPKYWSY